MSKLSLLVCLTLVYALNGCGKKEPAPAPQAQVQAPVEKPAPPPEAATAPVVEQQPAPVKKMVSRPGTYTVQVAAWETKENAEKLAGFYNDKGYEARVEQVEVGSDQWFRVRVGTYDNSAKAREVSEEIADKYKSNIWLVKL